MADAPMSREDLIWKLMISVAGAEGKTFGGGAIKPTIDRAYVLDLLHVIDINLQVPAK